MIKSQELEDTQIIRRFMKNIQPTRDTVVLDPPEEERILRGRLVLEETLELLEALGLKAGIAGAEPAALNPKDFVLVIDPDSSYDPVATLDALSDGVVVMKGSGIQLGLPVDEATLTEVGPSNMSKLDKDGNGILDAGGKLTKGPDFFEPRLDALVDKYTIR